MKREISLFDSQKKNIFGILIYLAVGILTGLVAALMVVSESHSLNQFYNGGAVYDITYTQREMDAEGYVYSAADGRFEITQEEAHKYISLFKDDFAWRYVIMEISEIQPEKIAADIICYKATGEYAGEQQIELTEGKNVITIDTEQYAIVDIRITGQIGATLSFDKIQFREKLLLFTKTRFFVIFGIAFFVYTLIVSLVIQLYRRFCGSFEWYAVIRWLQDFYILAGEKTGKYTGKIGQKTKSRIRVALFLFLNLYMQVIMDLRLYEPVNCNKIQMAVGALTLFCLAACCYEKKMVRIPWKNRLTGAWLLLWSMACISDFIVGKRYAFLGYIMFLCMGFFYFAWHNMQDTGQIIREFALSIRISFFFTTVFCFLCRPLKEGVRYLGTYVSPGMYAMYLLFVWAAFFSGLDSKISQKKINPLMLADMGCIVLSGWLMWKTQSSSGLIPAFLVAVIFLFRQFVLSGTKPARRRTVLICILTVLIAVPVTKAGEWGLTHIPYLLGTEVEIKGDDDYPATASLFFAPETVYASDGGIAENRIVKKLFGRQSFEKLSSLRNLYWKGYLRETNLLGHEYKVRIWNGNRWPHNGFIAILFRYGLFAVVPYTVMVLTNLAYAWRYLRKHVNAEGFFVFAVMAAAGFLLLMENLELPFVFLCWQAMYLMMGINFRQE